MSKILYFDCFSGVSGDMILGALVDCGLKLSDLKKELAKLKLGAFELRSKTVKRGHFSGTKIDIEAKKPMRFSNLKEMLTVIDKSAVDSDSKAKISGIIEKLAQAEAKVHKQTPQSVHFHQLGELDTIIDIAGSVLGAKLLGIEEMYSSTFTLGTGIVYYKNESFPLPAPATLEKQSKYKILLIM